MVKSTRTAPRAEPAMSSAPDKRQTPTAAPLPTPNAIGALDAIVGMHISLARGAVYRHFTETFTDIDLTQKQVAVLWLIEEHPGIAQADLGRRLQVDRATMMTIVSRLEDRGYVLRGKSRVDARRHTLAPTAAGRRALECARKAISEHETWLKSRFTPQEVETLVALLRRIHE